MILNNSKASCTLCNKNDLLVSRALEVCSTCISNRPDETVPHILKNHQAARRSTGLPAKPPRTDRGIICKVCANECIIGVGEKGYCGLRVNQKGRLAALTHTHRGLYYAYIDHHVTNCCSAPFCPGGTGEGYPRFAHCKGPEIGYSNLAIFFYGCNFNCLFCQNYSHKEISYAPSESGDKLISSTIRNSQISCWCFFGGSPEPQLPFSINVSRKVLELIPRGRILRICFEWNGCGNRLLVKRAAELAFMSGGNIKFDLKCWDESLSYALSGVSNQRAYENFAMIAQQFHKERIKPPILTASTLLIPGYVNVDQIERISKFIANLDVDIPYSLLVFHPDYLMGDLPVTPFEQVTACYKAAKKHLKNVTLGNLHLLSSNPM